MAKSYTDGPWGYIQESKINAKFSDNIFCILASEKGIICRTMGHDEDKDIARLIAAAPELLEALEGMLTDSPYKGFCANIEAAEAAIKKAKG